MKKVKIKIVKLGKQKHDSLFSRLEKYNSDIFTIDIYEKSRPNCDYEWGYTFNTLTDLLKDDFNVANYDICIGFTDTIIERNYFGKRLKDNNIYIISFFQVDQLLESENIDVFNYVIATIYRYVTRYNIGGEYLSHDETRGCIFDMCGDKSDIVYLCMSPVICEECLVKLKAKGVHSKYIETLKNEIKRIKKAQYYKITDFIKTHPYLSLLIGIIGTIIINIVSSFAFDYIKMLITSWGGIN